MNHRSYITFSARCELASKWLSIAAIVSIPLSTAATSIITGLIVPAWLAAGDYHRRLRQIRSHAVALWALALLALLIIGVFYSSATTEEALHGLKKYSKLLWIPVFITILHEPLWQRRGYYAFLGAMLLVLVASYSQLLGLLPVGPDGHEYNFFKSRIAHGIFMAYTLYLFLHHLWMEPERRALWLLLIAVAGYNLFFMVQGRSGYLVFFALIMLYMYQRWRSRGLILSLLIAVCLLSSMLLTSPAFKARIHETISDIRHYQQQDSYTATGLRLEFYVNTFMLITKHPLLGGGTGSFKSEYAALTAEHQLHETGNPHSEYLLIATQLGLLGIGVLFMLGYRQWQLSHRLKLPFQVAAQGLLVTMAVGCLFNSLLMDFSEGHFYTCLTGLYYGYLARPSGTRE
ncbi:MAG: O-antigen ligase family protein [Gammaproteobacteria bacterium]